MTSPVPSPVAPLPRQGVTHAIVAITPQTAARWLEGNVHNRPIRDTHVEALARDMLAGRWHMTGDSLKFDAEGTLLDGQHRLWAVVQANCTVPFLVVRGLHPEAQDYVDVGARRTVADALTLQGTVQSKGRDMATVARAWLAVQHTDRKPTHAEVLEYVRAHVDELGESVYWIHAAKTGGLRGGGLYGLAYYTLAQVDQEAAEAFFRALVSGVGLQPGDPILALRSRFLRTPPRVGSGGSHHRVNMAYVVRAWNAWRQGRQLTHIRHQAGDDYPIPR